MLRLSDWFLRVSRGLLIKVAVVLSLIEVPFFLATLLADTFTRVLVRSHGFRLTIWIGALAGSCALASLFPFTLLRMAVVLVLGIVPPALFLWAAPFIYDGGCNRSNSAMNTIFDLSEFLGYIDFAGWLMALTVLPAMIAVSWWLRRRRGPGEAMSTANGWGDC